MPPDPPPPAFAPTASSAATIAVQPTPIAMRNPTPIAGSAPGTTTVLIVVRRVRPIVDAACSSVGLMSRAPAIVLTTMGKNAAYATIATAAIVPVPSHRNVDDRDRNEGIGRQA